MLGRSCVFEIFQDARESHKLKKCLEKPTPTQQSQAVMWDQKKKSSDLSPALTSKMITNTRSLLNLDYVDVANGTDRVAAKDTAGTVARRSKLAVLFKHYPLPIKMFYHFLQDTAKLLPHA